MDSHRLTEGLEVFLEGTYGDSAAVACAKHQLTKPPPLRGLPIQSLSQLQRDRHEPILPTLAQVDFQNEIVEIDLVIAKGRQFNRSDAGIENGESSRLGTELVPAMWPEIDQAFYLIGLESDQNLLFFDQLG